MIVTCPKCRWSYDDTYRLTYCPHRRFEMRTHATNSKGEVKICTSVEELKAFVAT